MLTTIDNIKELPGMAENIRDKRILPYLQEIEDAHVIPAIGADLYERLDTGDYVDNTLLSGGYYNDKRGTRQMCHGIRKAVAYLAYSKLLRVNKVSVTAFGVSEKVGNFSHSANDDNVTVAANHAEKMGEFYLGSCLDYISSSEEHECCPEHKRTRLLAMEVIS